MKFITLTIALIFLSGHLIGCGDALVQPGSSGINPTVERGDVNTGKADRATIDPSEVTSEGSGEHGIEDPNQQDQVLHRALYAAAWAARVRFPRGAQHFIHFLENSGEIFEMDVDRLLADNPSENIEETTQSFQGRIKDQLALIKAEAETLIQEATEGQVPVQFSWRGEWSQFYATQGDWYWALGGFQFRIDAQVSYTPGAPVKVRYSVEVEDHYNWDAGKEIEFRFNLKITDEIFQRLHIVGIAQEFAIRGVSSVQLFEFDYVADSDQ